VGRGRAIAWAPPEGDLAPDNRYAAALGKGALVADLIAQGPDARNRWRRTLPGDQPVTLGREGATWTAPWDGRISRRHAELSWNGTRLLVRRIPEARNPIFFKGAAKESFEIAIGEHFVVGATTFSLADDRVQVSFDVPAPIEEQAFSTEYLHRLSFRHVGPHIDVLGRIPEVIAVADNDAELALRLVNLLLSGLPRASAAALVAITHRPKAEPVIDVLHWDRRNTGTVDFQPSQRLILDAVCRGESVLHVWNAVQGDRDFTINQGVDWAFCTPVAGKACSGWALYVAGRFANRTATEPVSDPSDLRDDLKFTELAATTLGALCDVRTLERERAGLRQFFAPPVLEALQGVDPDLALAPREAEVTVLFCDLRGFSRASERSAADLLGLLERVSRALGVATHRIRAEGGVVGDFHGDATMGFWGWPLPQPDAALRAARAALAIRAEFEQPIEVPGTSPTDRLSNFEVGIGIATGRAVAGKIGTVDQVKVTVFGPVVNLASRLEGLTKHLHASILLDEKTAAALPVVLPADIGILRRVAVVNPYGLERSLAVSELLPSSSQSLDADRKRAGDYERALDAFVDGDWQRACELLHQVSPSDRVKEFLAGYIAQHGRVAPVNWNGVIAMTSK
jgi:adenylate cyclase